MLLSLNLIRCHNTLNFLAGNINLKSGHSICVSRRAKLSLECDPSCKEKAESYVSAVFEECYKDKSPF